MKRLLKLLMVLGGSLTPLAGFGATEVIFVSNFQFSPADVIIDVGDSVRWMWQGGSHTTTSGTGPGDPQSGDLWRSVLNSGTQSFARKFNNVGTFDFYCEPHFPNMLGSVTVLMPTGVFEELHDAGLAPRAALFQNVPNPFNASTLVGFSTRSAGPVTLTVYNILGRQVRALADGEYEPGARLIEWDGTDENGNELASGVYFYRLSTRDGSETRKMILLR